MLGKKPPSTSSLCAPSKDPCDIRPCIDSILLLVVQSRRYLLAQAAPDQNKANNTPALHSKLRQVPDNQEVWIDRDGFTSLVFEIDERVGEKGNGPEIDGAAMTTHLEEIVGEDIDRTKVWNTTPTLFSKLE